MPLYSGCRCLCPLASLRSTSLCSPPCPCPAPPAGLTAEHIAATKKFIQHTLAMDDVYYVTMRQMGRAAG